MTAARPMTAADYAAGNPVSGQVTAARNKDPIPGGHIGDIIFGAIIAAAAFWLVPKVLDGALERVRFHDDFDDEDTELEVTE